MNPGAVEIRIGLGSCGVASGAEPIRDILQQAGEVKTVGCNGMCHLETAGASGRSQRTRNPLQQT
jgi:hypothetical protein